MNRPKEIRTAPREWMRVLKATCEFLRQRQSVSDLVLFGSQAMSVYMKSPLRSKDLDFLSSQVGLRQVEALAKELVILGNVQTRGTSVQTRMFDGAKMTTYAVELRIVGLPFFVKVFDKILDGRPTSLLGPYLELKERWGLEIRVPTLEALVSLRLAFRRPEGITHLNALRLNSLIRENRRSMNYSQVNLILHKWNIDQLAEQNLIALYRKNRIRIIGDARMLPGIENNMKSKRQE